MKNRRLSLGQSNDATESVRAEIRAAELEPGINLELYRTIRIGRRLRTLVLPRKSRFELIGVECHRIDVEGGDYSPDIEAGWLARELAMHNHDDADGWPWDVTRPVAGQYEEHVERVRLATAVESAVPWTDMDAAEQAAHDGYTGPAVIVDVEAGEEPEEGIEVLLEDDDATSDYDTALAIEAQEQSI